MSLPKLKKMPRLRRLADEQKPLEQEQPTEEFNAPEGLGESEPSLEEARQMAEDAGKKIDAMVQSFHSLYETLNQIADKYPGLYDELKLVCKFPNENVAEDVAQMNAAFDQVHEHIADDSYLSGMIGLKKE